MAIYRGPGGAGDATTDSSTEAAAAVNAAAQAATSATQAASSATQSANSATAASSSASSASTSASTATTKANEAASSASDASVSALAASTSATNAAASASTATTQANNASTSATSASTSASTAQSAATLATSKATDASNAASVATTKATEASTSASNAATSETNAASSASSASTSASTATTQASNAATSATAAAASASTATTKASEAATSATNAATSATNAANSATAAATSATNAASSATSAAGSATSAASAQIAAETARDQTLAAYDNFDDRYLGTKSVDPTVDNDGNALIAGALYFSSTDEIMKVYTGSTWVAAYASLSGALMAANNLSDLASVSSARTNLGLGTAALVADNTLVHLAGTETITGDKTFSSTITGSITGNAGTVTNGVYTTGSYADPTWITSIAGSKVSGNISGNAATATTATNQSGGTVAATTGSFSSSVTLSGGTANGVAYLNGSKVLTTGTSLVFDGTALSIGTTTGKGKFNSETAAATSPATLAAGTWDTTYSLFGQTGTATGQSYGIGVDRNNLFVNLVALAPSSAWLDIKNWGLTHQFYVSGSEQMRLTSTGLGIGTSSPSGKLNVSNAGTTGLEFYPDYLPDSTSGTRIQSYNRNTSAYVTQGYNANDFRWYTASTERMRLDSSGNLGLGVTPSAWAGGVVAAQVKGAAIWSSGNDLNLFANANYSPSGSKYINSSYASAYQQAGGAHYWLTAPSGTAGNAISFTQAMTLDASGNLALGTTTNKVTELSGAGNGLTIGGATAPCIGIWDTSDASYLLTLGQVDTGSYVLNKANGPLILGTNNTERMRIDSSGNLGIGTSSPNAQLNLSKSASGAVGPEIRLNNDASTSGDAARISLAYSTSLRAALDMQISASGTGEFLFKSGIGTLTERMRIDSSGNVGIGTSNPSRKLDVNGSIQIASNNALYINGSGNYLYADAAAVELKSDTILKFVTGSGGGIAERMRIDSSGNVGIGTSSPGQKLSVAGTVESTSGGFKFPDGTTQNTAASGGFPSGTLMLFQQTAAPTGWTKQTTHDNKALRVVSGTASSGGTSSFTTVFTNQTPTITTSGLSAAATTLATTQIPSHTHTYASGNSGSGWDGWDSQSGPYRGAGTTAATGGGGSHTHSISGSATSSAITLNVAYVDLIIASKN